MVKLGPVQTSCPFQGLGARMVQRATFEEMSEEETLTSWGFARQWVECPFAGIIFQAAAKTGRRDGALSEQPGRLGVSAGIRCIGRQDIGKPAGWE